MEKMSVANQAKYRADFYEAFEAAVNRMGYATEPFKNGVLVELPGGYWAKVNVAIANAEKFSIDEARHEYAEILAARAARAEVARQKAEEKAKKAKDKAEVAAEQATN